MTSEKDHYRRDSKSTVIAL